MDADKKEYIFSVCGQKSFGKISDETGVSKTQVKRLCDSQKQITENETNFYDEPDDKYLGVKLLSAMLVFLSLFVVWITYRKVD